MKSLRAVLVVLLFLLLAASMAQASVVVEPGAPADYSRLRWADAVIHTNPVLGRGLGPEMVSPGYQIVPLSATDQNGQPVTAYISWMTGRNGKKVWVKFRPGEPVEAVRIGSRTIERDGCQWIVEAWHAKRVVRCGNPTSIDFYVWKKIEIQTRTVPGPERIKEIPKPYPVFRTQLVYTAAPVWIPTPHSSTYIVEHPGIIGGLLGVGAAYAGRTRISITATGGSAAASAAAASSSTATNNTSVDVDNTNVNINQNQQQQQ